MRVLALTKNNNGEKNTYAIYISDNRVKKTLVLTKHEKKIVAETYVAHNNRKYSIDIFDGVDFTRVIRNIRVISQNNKIVGIDENGVIQFVVEIKDDEIGTIDVQNPGKIKVKLFNDFKSFYSEISKKHPFVYFNEKLAACIVSFYTPIFKIALLDVKNYITRKFLTQNLVYLLDSTIIETIENTEHKYIEKCRVLDELAKRKNVENFKTFLFYGFLIYTRLRNRLNSIIRDYVNLHIYSEDIRKIKIYSLNANVYDGKKEFIDFIAATANENDDYINEDNDDAEF